MQRHVGLDPFHHHFRQGDAHAGDGLLARGAVRNDLADHRVVVGRHEVAVVGVRVHADARTTRHVPRRDAARRGRELERIFRVDAALDRVALEHDVLLAEAQLFAGRHADLLLHDVDARDHFRDRMFDLYARVHFDEVELAVLVQELERAGATVADLLAGLGAAVTNAFDQAARNVRCRRFLNHLLVAALHGAIALAQPDGIAVLVGQDLDLHVTRMLQELLHIDFRIAEGAAGFFARHVDGVDQRSLGVHHAHATATAAASCLDDHRIADLLGRCQNFLRVFRQGAFRARHARHA